jgi:hypothetical protein
MRRHKHGGFIVFSPQHRYNCHSRIHCRLGFAAVRERERGIEGEERVRD